MNLYNLAITTFNLAVDTYFNHVILVLENNKKEGLIMKLTGLQEFLRIEDRNVKKVY